MERLLPVVIVLALASAYGLWYRSSRGKVKSSARAKLIALDQKTLGSELGERATLVQFSSAFCTPCRMTRTLISDVITDMPDVRHIDIDAESHLDLVRRLDIRSTPTTLFLDSSGIERGRAIGAPKRNELIEAITALKA
ncbi:MAG: thioredoxin family protein [Candidatus Nanopelagicaceae bacterium]